MYHNILVPIVFDAQHKTSTPIEMAKALAAPNAKITLLHVLEDIPSYVTAYVPVDYMSEARSASAATLKKLAAEIPGAVSVVVAGHSGRTILDYAKENKSDLIIIHSHRPEMQDVLLGSTATHVVRHAQCSVHILR